MKVRPYYTYQFVKTRINGVDGLRSWVTITSVSIRTGVQGLLARAWAIFASMSYKKLIGGKG